MMRYKKSVLRILPRPLWRWGWWGIFALSLSLAGCDWAVHNPVGSGVSEARFERLTQGVNLSHWFAQQPINDRHLRTHITATDLAQIRAAGFRHVRLPVDPYVLFSEAQPDIVQPRYLARFQATLDLILAHNLAVIVELHPDTRFKERLQTDAAFRAVFTRFWRAFATWLRPYDPEYVFLEVLNECMFSDAELWQAFQQELLAAMRAGAPDHTLIAAGHSANTLGALTALTPVSDPNVVYNFHFYEPLSFTHQGATWGLWYWPQLRQLPYPVTSTEMTDLLPQLPDAVRAHARAYADAGWSAQHIVGRLSLVALWAEQHQVRITCNEFGAYRPFADEASRLRWLTDVRTALETHGIGWAVWDYAEGFGVATETAFGQREMDGAVLDALGL